MKHILRTLHSWLRRLSFRTGVILVFLCMLSYAVSFAQILLPMSAAMHGALWVVFFGLAKTLQYTAIAVLGATGMEKIKKYIRRRRKADIS
ncbi:MAG: hypothetical protein K2F63_04565 [Muribaculaceae bacterium]|nr:hypothetical protein [Muribaculaceae bacterium]MDE6135768.1 hypothetical protein [Muribaculaceae bacterium]